MTADHLTTAASRNGPPPPGHWLGTAAAVMRFQLDRLLTRPRLAMALIGAIFPAAVMFAVIRTAPLERNMAVVMIYALIPEALCVLGLLVTMCPVVADELERGTWIHVAVRPGGRRSLLLGTFACASAPKHTRADPVVKHLSPASCALSMHFFVFRGLGSQAAAQRSTWQWCW